MTTKKERELMAEIMDLAVDVNLTRGKYSMNAAYVGYIHVFELRVLEGISQINRDCDWAHLSGMDPLWKPDRAIERLEQMLAEVKKHHPQFDADGVKL